MMQSIFPRKGCLLLVIKSTVMFTVLFGGVIGFPMWMILELTSRMDNLGGTIISLFALYWCGVLANYLLVRWRESEKNLPSVKKDLGFDEEEHEL